MRDPPGEQKARVGEGGKPWQRSAVDVRPLAAAPPGSAAVSMGTHLTLAQARSIKRGRGVTGGGGATEGVAVLKEMRFVSAST